MRKAITIAILLYVGITVGAMHLAPGYGDPPPRSQPVTYEVVSYGYDEVVSYDEVVDYRPSPEVVSYGGIGWDPVVSWDR